MASSLIKNYIHIVFSTKNRTPWIDETIEDDLFYYLAKICTRIDCTPIKIGGYLDHVHILCLQSKHISLVEVIVKLKSNSSKWIKTQGSQYQEFKWQNGYACFSTDYRMLDKMMRYIENQKTHHQSNSYANELIQILNTFNIPYNPEYLLD